MIALLLLLTVAESRTFHVVPLAQVKDSPWTHVQTCGPVVYVRKQPDGDWHITLDNGRARVVLEIIPELPMDPPKKGQTIQAKGISRFDKDHGWPELHPVIAWHPVKACKT